MSRIDRFWAVARRSSPLEQLVRDRNTPQKVVWRSRIVLLSADGLRPPAVAAVVGRAR